MIQMINNEDLVTYEVIVNEKVEDICQRHCDLHHIVYNPEDPHKEIICPLGVINHSYRQGNLESLYFYYLKVLPEVENENILQKDLENLKDYMENVMTLKEVSRISIAQYLKPWTTVEDLEEAKNILKQAAEVTQAYQGCLQQKRKNTNHKVYLQYLHK